MREHNIKQLHIAGKMKFKIEHYLVKTTPYHTSHVSGINKVLVELCHYKHDLTLEKLFDTFIARCLKEYLIFWLDDNGNIHSEVKISKEEK